MAKGKQEILPSFLIEALYKNSLIMEQSSPRDLQPADINIEKRNILVVVHSTETTLNEKQAVFLQSILKACKIEASNVNIISSGSPQFGDYKQLNSIFGAEKCLLFGLEPAAIQLPLNFPTFQIQSYQNQQYIWAPTLEELENDKSQKITLWNSLQKIFQIK
jgi:DNA polymerase III psi subunit